jgi:ADP-ribose pyrophosphatase
MNKWVKTKEELVYDGYRKIVKRTFTLGNGKSATFDISVSQPGVAILAVTPNNEVVCFKQFRPGPEEVLYELPGGGTEPGEDFATAAARELLEETGYSAEVEPLGSYYRDAYVSGKWQMFIGRNAVRVDNQKLDDTEEGEVAVLSLSEFKEKLFEGLMTDTTLGYAGLLKLGLL